MPATARREIVRPGEVGVYHCWARCVRRAFLCGEDPLTGQNFDHRRDWLVDLQRRLAGLFGVEIAFHAEMSNHLHVVLRSRPDIVEQWTDEEVARRHLLINRLVRSLDGETTCEPTDREIAVRTADPERVAFMRGQLANISRYMGAVCECVARRANREDGCTGRFWEGRFHCRSLEDEAAILVCGIYVDLNPIRAGEAETPEESNYTSARDRIEGLRGRLTAEEDRPTLTTTTTTTTTATAAIVNIATHAAIPPDGWLCELTVDERSDIDLCALNRTSVERPWRASEKGLLPIRLVDYLELLDATGRMLRQGTRGAIPATCAPILERLGIKQSLWTDLVTRFDRLFGSIVGPSARVAERAAEAGRKWYRGSANCAAAFG